MTPVSTAVRVIGRYSLYGALASGGMATVHFGRLIGPVGFSRTVAIKRLHPQFAADPEFVAMFLDEARLAARIRHPNVVPTLDVVATAGELFLVMEYVPGESLARLVRALRTQSTVMPPAITVAVLVGVLQGLHAAHEAKNEQGEPLGIVHRDVSPQNVLVGADGQARVLDFGVAKAAGRVQTTREGQLKGKLAYMAPEQLRGETCTRKTDIYAAAVVLWEALTGERLFRSDNEGAVVAKVLDGTVDAPSRASTPALDAATRRAVAALDGIVMRGLARDPASRFETARAMALALEKALAPATSSQVSEWVETTASDVLVMRAAQVAEIESSSAELARTSTTAPSELDADLPLLPKPGEPRSGGTIAVQVAVDGQSAGALSSLSVASNSPPPKSLEPGRRRGLWLAVGVGLLVLGPLVGFGITRGMLRSDATVGASPSSNGTGSSPSVSASAPVVEPPLPPAAAAVANPPDAAAPSASAPAPSRTPPRVTTPRTTPATNKTSPAHASACDPPFTYDATGKKHYKPECL
jgi:eukaryotic-like serine/threonine-protein kinase